MQHILLHGLGQDSSSWNQTISHIQDKQDIFCPNLFDFLDKEEATYQNLYRAFSQYCENLSAPFDLCGLSLGGILALQYGIEHSDRVHSAVLIGIQYAMPKKLLKLQNAIFRLMPRRTFQNMGITKEAFIQLSQSMTDLNFQHELNRLVCPTLVLCGERDRVNEKAALELTALLPHADLKFIKNARHDVNVDAPEALGALLNDFFITD